MSNDLDEFEKEIHALYGDRDVPFWNLRAHIKELIKSRKIQFTADCDHLSAAGVLRQFQKIDEPRKYDFQSETVNEDNFIKTILEYYLPILSYEIDTDSRKLLTLDYVADVIAGKESISIICKKYQSGCYDCGKHLRITICGDTVHMDGAEPCDHNRTFSVEVDFPTGEIVFSDWPARFSEAKAAGLFLDNDFSINQLHGQRKATEMYATKNNMFFASVGNSCPSLFVTGNGNGTKLRIGKGASGYKNVGYFCTDLWWTTILDKKFYDQIVAELPPADSDDWTKEINTTKIKPGRYRFTIVDRYTDYDEDNDDSGDLYSYAEWISESRNSDYQFPTRTLMEFGSAVKTLSRMAGGDSRMRTADYIFNVNGNGLRSLGKLYDKFALDDTTPAPDDVTNEDLSKFVPYPNFEERYSLLYRGNNINQELLAALPVSWLEAARDYYSYCKTYFEGSAEGFSSKFPSANHNFGTFSDALEKRKKPGMTNDEWKESITRDYHEEFNGDVLEFGTKIWEKKRISHVRFCNKTVKLLDTELKTRL